jgi:hypothetical protein
MAPTLKADSGPIWLAEVSVGSSFGVLSVSRGESCPPTRMVNSMTDGSRTFTHTYRVFQALRRQLRHSW